ncbi:MAG: aldolase/citrate lyase family protein [Pseudomonadota bacterium]
MAAVNPIKEKLAAGQSVMGIWSIISSPAVVEILALAGLDFVILDMEHGIYDVAALDACVRSCEAAGSAALVRVPGMNASAVQWALDLGAHGIVVPQVGGVAQADEAVRMGKFAPSGTRGYNPFTRAGGYSNPSSNTGGKLGNAFGLSAVIIENAGALAELDAICALPDLDVVYVGVYDLSVALGCAGNTKDPRITDIVRSSVRTIRAAGKGAAIMVRSPAEIEAALALGANVLVYGVDTFLISQAAGAAVAALRLHSGASTA